MSEVKTKKENRLKKSWGSIAFDAFNITFMFVLMVIMAYPLWHVVCASFSVPSELMRHIGPLYKPLGFTLSSYGMVFRNNMIMLGYSNSIYILVVGTTINVILTAICAFVLSRKGVYWNALFSKLIVLTMFIGGGLVPTYLVVTKMLHLNNNLWALILPNAISVYNMIIMRTSFLGIPDSLEESAKLDGAGVWTILFKIILPLSKAVIAVMILYYGVAHWNAWFEASIYLKDRELYPLQLVLREILIANSTESMMDGVSNMDQEMVGETIKYSVIVLTTVPILLVYPFLQKYFVKGVMIGAVKG